MEKKTIRSKDVAKAMLDDAHKLIEAMYVMMGMVTSLKKQLEKDEYYDEWNKLHDYMIARGMTVITTKESEG